MGQFAQSAVLLLVGVSYGIIAVIATRRRGLFDPIGRVLVAYTLFSAAWALLQGGLYLGWMAPPPYPAIARLPHAMLAFLALVFIDVTRAFMRLVGPARWWWIFGGSWLAFWVIADAFLIPSQVGLGTVTLPAGQVVIGAVALGWAAATGKAWQLVIRDYRARAQPLHRNRLTYWGFTLLLTTTGGVFFYTANLLAGTSLYYLGTVLAAYALLTHRQIDIRRGILRGISLTLTTLVTAGVYFIAYWVVQFVFQMLWGQPPLVSGLVLAALLTIGLNPALARVRNLVEEAVSGGAYDDSKTVRDYSATISNILDLEMLTTVALGLISEALATRRGLLLSVDANQGSTKNRDKIYEIRPVGGIIDTVPPPLAISAHSPIAAYLSKEHLPLTQYDLDILETFQRAPAGERQWLAALKMDVYIPIYSKGNWMGLLALGPKAAGIPYTARDLDLVSTLADQTAVALENARLVEGLIRVNRELERAYAHLDKTKRDLERLDRAKTDFISIASHELRTPITIIHGYSQMLGEAPLIANDPYFSKLVDSINRGTERLNEIIENLLDIAKIDSQELQISSQPVALGLLIQSITQSLAKALAERKQTLELQDLKSLPPITADQEALKKVVYNLVVNAIKYTPDGGTITIAGRSHPEGFGSLSAPAVEFSVADTGIGIDPEHHQLIFRKFYQTGELSLHSSGKTKFKGAGPGLGLAIAQGVVKAHGGEIWVESPGHDEIACPGSKFFVVLPVSQDFGEE